MTSALYSAIKNDKRGLIRPEYQAGPTRAARDSVTRGWTGPVGATSPLPAVTRLVPISGYSGPRRTGPRSTYD